MFAVPEHASKPSGGWSRLLPDTAVFATGAVVDLNKNGAGEIAKKYYVMTVEVDIANEQAIQNAVKTVVEKWNAIDVLVNNVAVFTFGAVEDVSAEVWTRILNVNVRGFALMAKAVVPLMKKRQSGSIIQMGSISSWIAQSDLAPYSTTKGAVLQMTRNLALDLGPFNIRCHAICLGATVTPVATNHAAFLNITLDELIAPQAKNRCLKR